MPQNFGTCQTCDRSVVDLYARLARKDERIAALEAALAPFATFAHNVDADGWTSNIHREQISTWFGPSDFRAAGKACPQPNPVT